MANLTLVTDDYRVTYEDAHPIDITCAFNRFNGGLFNNELPATQIRWASSIVSIRKPGRPLGLLALPNDPRTFEVPNQLKITIPHIFIIEGLKGLSPLDEWVLLHEMCHHRVLGHGNAFIEELKRVLDKNRWGVLLGDY